MASRSGVAREGPPGSAEGSNAIVVSSEGDGQLERGRRPDGDWWPAPGAPEQRLDASPQLRIRRTFPIEDGSPLDGIRGFDRRPEDGLNTFRINGHGIVLGKG